MAQNVIRSFTTVLKQAVVSPNYSKSSPQKLFNTRVPHFSCQNLDRSINRAYHPPLLTLPNMIFWLQTTKKAIIAEAHQNALVSEKSRGPPSRRPEVTNF